MTMLPQPGQSLILLVWGNVVPGDTTDLAASTSVGSSPCNTTGHPKVSGKLIEHEVMQSNDMIHAGSKKR